MRAHPAVRPSPHRRPARRAAVLLAAAVLAGCGTDGSPVAPVETVDAPPAATPGPPPPDAAAGSSCLAAVEVDGRRYVWWEPPAGIEVPPATGDPVPGVVPPCADMEAYEGTAGSEPSPVEVRALEGVPLEEAVLLGERVHLADPADVPGALRAPSPR